ncbi:MAG: hypothetical protein JETCAE02_08940 [Anaerolineaceae bacterium]|nr:DUF402 domain-containing protein [Anaerolineae bacterium]MBL1171243.1 DUF402 domain-containing protein [Chloroflexota bacterium]MCL4822788.1 DUF402 domain-containing protein [Anaerolineales bacterium]MDL1925511.1 DUF402 domain-containing protein [Anaerolineae bacterium AMX1]GJQ38482.1 MAG: hypothetical protein JETCAE02_08940 [Anaerolineaceae bacterium]
MREKIIVDKLSPQGELKWRYEGETLERRADRLTLEAFFDRDDTPLADAVLKRGDRFVETYYADRWYNIFEIYDRDSGALKGWYCNITRPSKFTDGRVEYVDLFLDLWVSVDGRQTVLDEDEFLAAGLDEATRRAARAALTELQGMFKSKQPSV